jgi:hypothetical protein
LLVTHPTDDLPRLTSLASGEPEALVELVRALQRESVPPKSLARVEERLGPLLDTPKATRAARGASRKWIWLMAAAIVVTVLAAVAAERYGQSRSGRRETSGAAADAPAGQAAPPEPQQPAAPPPAADRPNDETAQKAPARAAAPSASAFGLREDDLLARAKQALSSSPATTLALAEEHARRFPRGALIQEREVIAIQALLALGRRSEAQARGNAFLRAYPTSIYRTKIDQLLGRVERDPAAP